MRSISFWPSTEHPPALKREGGEGSDADDRNDRPPDRAAEMLDQIPDEELVEQEAERIDDEEAELAHARPVAGAVALEAPAAVEDVAQRREGQVVEGQRQ